ncbi:MAG: phosphotransferase family protein, partial [Gemmatimonadota bacterium]
MPRVLGVAEIDDGRRALVRTFENGVALPMRADRARIVDGRPWEVVGRVAVGVHAIDVASVADVVSGHRTRRAHAEAELEASFAGVGSDVDDARAWLETNLPPPEEPARPLHGDLLGQNILVGREAPMGEERPPALIDPALIDWEYARTGDPAYDLAIVTRGVRRPFGTGGGLRKLVASYADAGGAPLGEMDVRFYELCLAARWYGASLAGRGAVWRARRSTCRPAARAVRFTRRAEHRPAERRPSPRVDPVRRTPTRSDTMRLVHFRAFAFAALFASAALGARPAPAAATWSIIAVDLETGRVLIASATC